MSTILATLIVDSRETTIRYRDAVIAKRAIEATVRELGLTTDPGWVRNSDLKNGRGQVVGSVELTTDDIEPPLPPEKINDFANLPWREWITQERARVAAGEVTELCEDSLLLLYAIDDNQGTVSRDVDKVANEVFRRGNLDTRRVEPTTEMLPLSR